MDAERTVDRAVDCIFCNHAILTMDGALRCKFTFLLTKEMCDKIDYGKFEIWKPEKMVRKMARKVRK